MNMKEARDQLKKIAGGKYSAMQYKLTDFSDAAVGEDFAVYVEGFDWHHAKTWEDAIQLLQNQMNGVMTDVSVATENLSVLPMSATK